MFVILTANISRVNGVGGSNPLLPFYNVCTAFICVKCLEIAERWNHFQIKYIVSQLPVVKCGGKEYI